MAKFIELLSTIIRKDCIKAMLIDYEEYSPDYYDYVVDDDDEDEDGFSWIPIKSMTVHVLTDTQERIKVKFWRDENFEDFISFVEQFFDLDHDAALEKAKNLIKKGDCTDISN